jgi:transcriptional regulator with XRE-family HTH domain
MIFDKNAASIDVGIRLRELREMRQVSMRRLAQMSGLSANALSMIERGKTSPSVSTLYKLAEALGVSITEFFRQKAAKQKAVFLKANERTRIPFARGLMEGLGGEHFVGRTAPFLLTLESGAHSGPQKMVHTGHEFVFCIRGMLEYQVESQVYTLEPGDSLLFAAHLRHNWRNAGGTVINAIVVISDYTEGDRSIELHWEMDDEK